MITIMYWQKDPMSKYSERYIASYIWNISLHSFLYLCYVLANKIDSMAFNAVSNVISVISRRQVHLIMLFWGSFHQYFSRTRLYVLKRC